MTLEQFKADLEAIGHPEAYDMAIANYEKEETDPIEDYISENECSSELLWGLFVFSNHGNYKYWWDICDKLEQFESQ